MGLTKTENYTAEHIELSQMMKVLGHPARIAILQSIPAISPLNPLTAIFPLMFVLFISMAREGYEDFQRYKSDKCKFKFQYF